uniref:Uncharacterized protein n=1 Tax=Glossina pallidipes TaxID=7398 RepID=A0A1B0AK37_GLOPL
MQVFKIISVQGNEEQTRSELHCTLMERGDVTENSGSNLTRSLAISAVHIVQCIPLLYSKRKIYHSFGMCLSSILDIASDIDLICNCSGQTSALTCRLYKRNLPKRFTLCILSCHRDDKRDQVPNTRQSKKY